MVRTHLLPCAIGVSALPVFSIFSLLPSATSQTQPLPNCAPPASANSFVKFARLPKSRSMSVLIFPDGAPPFGVKHAQKKVWSQACAALLKIAVSAELFADSR